MFDIEFYMKVYDLNRVMGGEKLAMNFVGKLEESLT